jgi:hypothetical protein
MATKSYFTEPNTRYLHSAELSKRVFAHFEEEKKL